MRHRLKDFIQHEVAGGVFLVLATLLAVILANSPFAYLYENFLRLHVEIGVKVEESFFGLSELVHVWINEALMALFFLFIGLEIKREMLQGELARPAQRFQPLLAVACGIALPIVIYALFNHGHKELMRGWAIPCATDTAFALGVLTLVGSRVKPAIRTLLMAIAVIDDLIAILIIAFFYTSSIDWPYLILAGAGLLSLILQNRLKFQHLSFYLLAGFVTWLGFFEAGIHPTLAGVLTAFAIPLQAKGRAKPLLLQLEHLLHPWVVFGILPLFAFINAGLSFSALQWQDMINPLPLSILAGLSLGKPAGILCGLYLGNKTGLAPKPQALRWRHYLGMALLCGMGFTLPLFIGTIAFTDDATINLLKLGVLSACLLSAVIGWTVCRLSFKP